MGLFRYWTVPNIPLFLLAMPMFFVMTASGFWAIRVNPIQKRKTAAASKNITYSSPHRVQVFRNLAVIQLFLTLFTFTTAHVQIITRLSSAYPILVWYLTMAIVDRKEGWLAKHCINFMVIYPIVQGGLFASFLPPA